MESRIVLVRTYCTCGAGWMVLASRCASSRMRSNLPFTPFSTSSGVRSVWFVLDVRGLSDCTAPDPPIPADAFSPLLQLPSICFVSLSWPGERSSVFVCQRSSGLISAVFHFSASASVGIRRAVRFCPRLVRPGSRRSCRHLFSQPTPSGQRTSAGLPPARESTWQALGRKRGGGV